MLLDVNVRLCCSGIQAFGGGWMYVLLICVDSVRRESVLCVGRRVKCVEESSSYICIACVARVQNSGGL